MCPPSQLGTWELGPKKNQSAEKIYNLVPYPILICRMLCVLSAFCVKIRLVYIYIDWPVAMESEYFNFSPFIALPSTIKHKDAVLEQEP